MVGRGEEEFTYFLSKNERSEMFVENMKIKIFLEADPMFGSKVSFPRINLIECQRLISCKVGLEKRHTKRRTDLLWTPMKFFP